MRINIKDMKVGNKVTQDFILKTHKIKETKTGKNYLDLVLCDKTGEISCKMWDISPEVENLIDGDFCVATITIEEYEGNKQGKVTALRYPSLTDEINKMELIPMAPYEAQKMFEHILEIADTFESEELKNIVKYVYEENKELLLFMPGAKSVHHDMVSGLLYHVFGMLRIAQALSKIYPQVNKDLLCTGVILHDIYKTREFATGPVGLVYDYTTAGKLLGHLAMGATYISKVCDKLNVEEETSLLLQHMLLSHHGEPEFGSAIRPAFLEAKLLNLCDTIDAQVQIFGKATEEIKSGEFSPRIFALEGSAYKPNYDVLTKNNTAEKPEE